MEIIVRTNIPLIVTGDLDINYIAGKQVVFYAEVEIRWIVLGIESYPSVAAAREIAKVLGKRNLEELAVVSV